MLFRRDELDGIAAGEITLAFRRWDRPRARVGARHRTSAGELEILAGLGDDRPRIYRVALRLAGPDRRVALREEAGLVEARPAVRAPELAAELGLETEVVKRDAASSRSRASPRASRSAAASPRGAAFFARTR